MTKEEAIRILASSCIPGSKQTEALETLIPELKESEDKRMMREFNDWLCEEIECLQNDLRDEEDRKTLNMLCYVLTKVKDWLEKQKESGIKWLKSDNVKNPDKPYIDKAGMFYTTDGRMCYASEIEKQKEHQELPLMNGDADLYFDTWRQEVPVPTFRQCFEEGMRYAQRLQKEQKPINHNFTTFHRDVVYCAMCDRNLDEGLRCNLEIVYKIIKDIVDRTPVIEEQKQEWSESDKQNINLIISYLDSYIEEHNDTFGADECKYLKYWLKSLRPNQSKSEWSEEDEDTINLMIAILRENYSNCLFKTNSANTIRMSAISTDMLIKRIEALRPQPKQEWSKEDEKMLKWAIRIIVEYSDIDEEGSEIVQNWLESLRPQYHGDVTMTEAYKMGLEAGKASHWKPSEEQIDRLFSIVAALRKDYCDDMADFLANLYADLKKLGVKEEPEYYQHFDPDC